MEKLHSEGKSPFVVDNGDADPRQSADNTSDDEDEEASIFADCPVEGCGEVITLAELEDHIELHAAEESASAGNLDSSPARSLGSSSRTRDESGRSSRNGRRRHAEASPASGNRSHVDSISKWKRILGMPAPSSSSSSSKTRPEASSRSSEVNDLSKRLGVSLSELSPVPHEVGYLQDIQKADLGRYAHEDRMPDRLVSLLRRGRYISSEGKHGLDIRTRPDGSPS